RDFRQGHLAGDATESGLYLAVDCRLVRLHLPAKEVSPVVGQGQFPGSRPVTRIALFWLALSWLDLFWPVHGCLKGYLTCGGHGCARGEWDILRFLRHVWSFVGFRGNDPEVNRVLHALEAFAGSEPDP